MKGPRVKGAEEEGGSVLTVIKDDGIRWIATEYGGPEAEVLEDIDVSSGQCEMSLKRMMGCYEV